MASQYVKLPPSGGSGPAAGVDSFNGRTGVVVSQASDYSATLVSFTPAGSIAATNTQDAIEELDAEKQAAITGNNSRLVVKNSAGDVEALDSLRLSTTGGIDVALDDSITEAASHNSNAWQSALNPTENSPNTSVNLHYTQANIDTANSGFNFGTGGNAVTLFSNQVLHEGTSDTGALTITSSVFTLGNGTDPIDIKGFSYNFGFGEVRSGVTINGPMQGYGYQPVIRAGATLNQSTSYTTAFYDNSDFEVTSSYHTSFNSSPNLDFIGNARSFTGLNVAPNVLDVDANAGITGVGVSGTYTDMSATGSFFNGVSVSPTITGARYAAGLNVNMDNVTTYAGVAASLVIQDLTIAADLPGSTANAVTIAYTGGGTAGAEVVSQVGLAFSVQIQNGVSTAQNIADALNAFVGFTTNLNVTISGTASNPQTTQAATNLAGGIDPGTKQAAYLDGDVQITGSLSFGGALSIGQLNAFASQAVVAGTGNPASIHSLVSNPTVGNNVTIANADTLGINTAMLLTIGTNSTVTTAFTGIAALALPAVVSMGSGSTVDQVSGGTFAISLDAGATGGTIGNLDLCRSIAIPNGTTTITRMSGYRMDLPFGNPATTAWGFYESPGVNNYFAGNLLIGGTAGSDDTVSNASVALEVKSTTKAIVSSRMTATQRDALTAIAGMQLFNTTTNKLQVYDGSSWVDLH